MEQQSLTDSSHLRKTDLRLRRQISVDALYALVEHDALAFGRGRILVARAYPPAIRLSTDTDPGTIDADPNFLPVAMLRPSPEAGGVADHRLIESELRCKVLVNGLLLRLSSSGRWGAWLAAVMAHRFGQTLRASRTDTGTSPPPVSLSFHDEIMSAHGRVAIDRYGIEWARFFTLTDIK